MKLILGLQKIAVTPLYEKLLEGKMCTIVVLGQKFDRS